MNETRAIENPLQLKTSMPAILGLVLGEKRKILQMSQKAFAESLDPPLTQGYWSKVEQGRVNASQESLAAAATSLNTTVEELLAEAAKLSQQLKGVVVLSEVPVDPDKEPGVWLPRRELAKLLGFIS